MLTDVEKEIEKIYRETGGELRKLESLCRQLAREREQQQKVIDAHKSLLSRCAEKIRSLVRQKKVQGHSYRVNVFCRRSLGAMGERKMKTEIHENHECKKCKQYCCHCALCDCCQRKIKTQKETIDALRKTNTKLRRILTKATFGI